VASQAVLWNLERRHQNGFEEWRQSYNDKEIERAGQPTIITEEGISAVKGSDSIPTWGQFLAFI
jgi:hypothetical protein